MHFEIPLLGVVSLTNRTLKAFDVPVPHHMLLEFVTSRKSFITNLAHMILYTTMNLQQEFEIKVLHHTQLEFVAPCKSCYHNLCQKISI